MDTLDLSLVAPDKIRPISRKEYDRMVEVGILDEDEKVELLRGVIVTMSPQGWIHGEVIVWLTERLIRSLDPSYAVRPQLPFAADDWSEPEPDLVVVKKDPKRREHPEEALLIIEVAVSSLRTDRKAKQIIYAENGVPEYWIVDAQHSTIEVFTQPGPGGYKQRIVLKDGDILRPTLLPGVEIAVADMPR